MDEPPLAHPEALISGSTQSPPLSKLVQIMKLWSEELTKLVVRLVLPQMRRAQRERIATKSAL